MTRAGKPALVLVPGMGNTPMLWDAQREALADDYDVIIPDCRGSESVAQMADCVRDSLRQGENALAGFSLGGYVALSLAERFPDRITRLALISSTPFADDDRAKAQRLRLIEKAREDYSGLL